MLVSMSQFGLKAPVFSPFRFPISMLISSVSLLQDPVTDKHVRSVLSATITNLLPISLFLFASAMQFIAHRHLAELPAAPDYTIPTHRIFTWTLTPHYLAECLIYLALAVVAAPSGFPVNSTVASAALFVFINLGITARETRKWYVTKFGEESIKTRAALLPGIW